MKKILLIIGIIAIVGLAVLLVMYSKPPVADENGKIGFSIKNFFPFGGNNGGTGPIVIDRGEPSQGEVPIGDAAVQPIPRLRKISSEPVAGAAVFNAGTTTVVRWVEKGTGNVYETRSDSASTERLTNTTIPKIVRAFWLPNGSGFLAQTLEESGLIETTFVKLKKNAATSTEVLTPFATTLAKLPTGIKEIAVKPDGSKIFYYTVLGESKWFVSNPDGTSASQVFSHALTEWLPKWISGNLISMQTKSSAAAVGYGYTFDTASKNLKKVGPGVNGLSSLPNGSGSFYLYSTGGASPQLALIGSEAPQTISVQTLADKCAWAKDKSPTVYCGVPNWLPKGNYPDSWYKGLVSADDSIQKIEAEIGISTNIADLSSISGEKIDVADPALSPDGSHLIFRNKLDGYLWILRIAE